jgi:cytochrome c biogenesis protein CcdA/peroxiredoxin
VEPTLPIAFVAGLISFISPCVLPLVPAYVGYMGGRLTHTIAMSGGTTISRSQRWMTFAHSLFFVAGFTFVFVSLGLLSTAFVSVIGGDNISAVTNLIGRIGGLMIIFFGLHYMGILPRLFAHLRANERLIGSPLLSIAFALIGSALILWAFNGSVTFWESPLMEYVVWIPLFGLIVLAAFGLWLLLDGAFTHPLHFWQNLIDRLNNAFYADTRRQMQMNANGGYSSSALMGVVFAAGWTPCIGPVYGSVLMMASGGGNLAQAGILLTAYSLGLGIPFMITALALDQVQLGIRRLSRHMRTIELVAGGFLVLIGVLVASGRLQSLSQQFSVGEFADIATQMETNVIDRLFQPKNGTQQPTALPTNEIANPQASLARPSSEPNAAAAPQLLTISDLAEDSSPAVGIAKGDLAPDFETVSDTGQPIRLSDYRGQVVLLNFWATWCGPCRAEMTEFQRVHETQDGITILAVNNREPVAAVQDFRQELGLDFPLVMDERASIQNRYNIRSYPSTFLIGRDGTILQVHYGALTSEDINQLVSTGLNS